MSIMERKLSFIGLKYLANGLSYTDCKTPHYQQLKPTISAKYKSLVENQPSNPLLKLRILKQAAKLAKKTSSC